MKIKNTSSYKEKLDNLDPQTVVSVVVVVSVLLCVISFFGFRSSNYNKATELLNNQQYEEAYEIFNRIGDYKDSDDKATEIKIKLTKDELNSKNVGDTLTFGKYDSKEMEWKVIDKKDGKLLITTKNSYFSEPYNDESNADTSWEESSLREYLNSSFYKSNFNKSEQALIFEAKIETKDENSTNDKIFILSKDEANKYFKSDKERIIKDKDGDKCWWWLRNQGKNETYAVYVDEKGKINTEGTYASEYNATRGVRPAMWIVIE